MAGSLFRFFEAQEDKKQAASPVPIADSDFADYAGAPVPEPASFSAIPSGAGGIAAAATGVPYTKWYNVHERYSASDFYQEGIAVILIAIVVVVHLWGRRANKARANAWIDSHVPVLEKEFAQVGFKEKGAPAGVAAELLKEQAPNQYSAYATGRQNIAFLDVNITLIKRYNPLSAVAEYATSFFIESVPTPVEKVEAILYPFDGKEAVIVPGMLPGSLEARKDSKSSYDGFVWAIVNKDSMKKLRDERYDVSLTSTKDHAKLPKWCTVMSESAEVTEFLLTPELIKAVEEAGEKLDYLIITDQPIEQPTTINETVPKKRVFLSTSLSNSKNDPTLPLFSYFIHLPDLLVQSAHFRPEVTRKVKATRDEMIKKLQKRDDDEKAEERLLEREKAKKLKRDLELKSLDAKGQKKYLEKEHEREQKKLMKKQTTRG